MRRSETPKVVGPSEGRPADRQVYFRASVAVDVTALMCIVKDCGEARHHLGGLARSERPISLPVGQIRTLGEVADEEEAIGILKGIDDAYDLRVSQAGEGRHLGKYGPVTFVLGKFLDDDRLAGQCGVARVRPLLRHHGQGASRSGSTRSSCRVPVSARTHASARRVHRGPGRVARGRRQQEEMRLRPGPARLAESAVLSGRRGAEEDRPNSGTDFPVARSDEMLPALGQGILPLPTNQGRMHRVARPAELENIGLLDQLP